MTVKVKNRVVKAGRKLAGENALAGWILTLKARIRKARIRAVLSANAELIRLYLDIGCEILDRVEKADWGSKVLETVSDELRRGFPGLHGFSVRNLKYMKAFAREWRGNAIGQQLVAQLPWGHNIVLLESVSSVGERLAYARLALKNGWQGELPDEYGNWYGATGVELAKWPLTVKNVTFLQRYPWNGLVDVTCDLTGAGEVKLSATALTNGVEFIEAKTLIGETTIDLDAAGGVTNGVKFIWNAANDLPAGFKASGVQIKVTAEKE